MQVTSGTRIGFWKPPFQAIGYYVGPDLGDQTIGTLLEQELMEGTLLFRVGVLFRPDLDKYNKLETILILQNYIPEMFQYEHWEKH